MIFQYEIDIQAFTEAMAKKAFEAYSQEVGGKTYDGKPIPPWESLTDTVKNGWRAVVSALYTQEVIS